MQINRQGSFTEKQRVRIANPVSVFNGRSGIVKKIMPKGGLCIEIKPHGILFFSRDECCFI